LWCAHVLLYPPWCQVSHTEEFVACEEFHNCKSSLEEQLGLLLLVRNRKSITDSAISTASAVAAKRDACMLSL